MEKAEPDPWVLIRNSICKLYGIIMLQVDELLDIGTKNFLDEE